MALVSVGATSHQRHSTAPVVSATFDDIESFNLEDDDDDMDALPPPPKPKTVAGPQSTAMLHVSANPLHVGVSATPASSNVAGKGLKSSSIIGRAGSMEVLDVSSPESAASPSGGQRRRSGERPQSSVASMPHRTESPVMRRATTQPFVGGHDGTVAEPPMALSSKGMAWVSSSTDGGRRRSSLSFVEQQQGGGVGTVRTSVTSLFSEASGGGGWNPPVIQEPNGAPKTNEGEGPPKGEGIKKRGGRVRLPSSVGLASHPRGAQQQQQQLLTSDRDRRGTLGTSGFLFGQSSSISISGMSAVSTASSIASFAFRSAIPFDFLDNKKLRRDRRAEASLRRAAEDAASRARSKHSSVAATSSVIPPGRMRSIPLSSTHQLPSSAPKGKPGTSKPVVTQQEQLHVKCPLSPTDDLLGPALVVGDCGDDIVAVVMVLATMESYTVEEHGKLLSNIFSYVLASGTGVYIALALSQGDTMNSLLDMLLQHDASFLRPPIPRAPKNAPYKDAFFNDGVDTIETVLKLRFADGERIDDNGDGNPRRVSHRYRRGDHVVTRPCVFVASPEGDTVHVADWNTEESIAALYAVAGNCIVRSSTAADVTSQSKSKAPPCEMVSLLSERFTDPMLFALTMHPRPTAVCRITLPGGSTQHDTANLQRTELMTKGFRSDFIDISLPEFVDLPPRGGGEVGNGAPAKRETNRHRGSLQSLGSSCSFTAQRLPTDPNAGMLSNMTIGLEAYTPMEDLLEQWNLEGAGKERRLAVMHQTEAFIEDVEGELQRAMDYLTAKAPKPVIATPTDGALLDALLDMPNSVH